MHYDIGVSGLRNWEQARVAGGLCSSLNWEAVLIFCSHSGSARFCIESRLNFWTFCDRCLSSHYITAATAFSIFIAVKLFSLCSVAHLASGDIKIAPWFSFFFFFEVTSQLAGKAVNGKISLCLSIIRHIWGVFSCYFLFDARGWAVILSVQQERNLQISYGCYLKLLFSSDWVPSSVRCNNLSIHLTQPWMCHKTVDWERFSAVARWNEIDTVKYQLFNISHMRNITHWLE